MSPISARKEELLVERAGASERRSVEPWAAENEENSMPDALQIAQRDTLISRFMEYLESGKAPSGLFADEVLATIHVGGGHYEVRTPTDLERELQQYGGPIRTEVLRHERTPSGFILEFTQRSPQGDLYEELVWAFVEEGQVQELRWYCTGIVPGA